MGDQPASYLSALSQHVFVARRSPHAIFARTCCTSASVRSWPPTPTAPYPTRDAAREAVVIKTPRLGTASRSSAGADRDIHRTDGNRHRSPACQAQPSRNRTPPVTATQPRGASSAARLAKHHNVVRGCRRACVYRRRSVEANSTALKSTPEIDPWGFFGHQRPGFRA